MGDTSISAVLNTRNATKLDMKAAKAEKHQEQYDFTSMVNQSVSSQVTQESTKYDTKIQNGTTSQNTKDPYQNKMPEIKEAQNQEITQDTKDTVSDKMDEFASEVTEELKEKFGVSEEEITEAMETLGLTFADLMDPKNLTALVSQLTNVTDTSELLLNGDFMQLMESVQQLTEDVLQELNLTMEEVQNICSEQTTVPAQTENNAFELSQNETLQSGQAEDGEDVKTTMDGVDRAETTTTAATNTVSQQTESDGKSEESAQDETLLSEETQTVGTDNTKEETTDFSENMSDAKMVNEKEMTHDTNNMAETNSMQNALNNNSQVEGKTAIPVPTSPVDVQNIIEQITEFSKTQISSDGTTISMQLNPESLGKVYLQIAYKEGAVTAQIAAQNETVKEALENQVAQLKENFNQQGIKVEAIEVTVASHEFERNLEENQQQMNQQQEKEEERAQGRRNLNLSDEDVQALFEDMTEEENLHAKIMLDSGNSVDMTA